MVLLVRTGQLCHFLNLLATSVQASIYLHTTPALSSLEGHLQGVGPAIGPFIVYTTCNMASLVVLAGIGRCATCPATQSALPIR